MLNNNSKIHKATDIFNQSPELFAKKVKFAEAFPSIKKLEMIVEESGMLPKDQNIRQYTLIQPPSEYINCTNSQCHGGGVQLGSIIWMMVNTKQQTLTKCEWCIGHEGSAKKKVRDCLHRFSISVSIDYK